MHPTTTVGESTMDRRDLMKAFGSIGIAGALGTGITAADSHTGQGQERGQNTGSSQSGTGAGYTPYGGRTTKTPDGLGGYDNVLMYLAAGIVDGPTESPREDDPNRIKWFQKDLMQRTMAEIVADRQACHDHWKEFWGIAYDGDAEGTVYVVDPVTGDETELTDPPSNGEVTEDNVFKTFVWEPEGTDAVVREFALMLDPKIGYTNYLKTGDSVPNNHEPANGTTNRDPFTPNKIRDGGYWIFGIEDDDIPFDSLYGDPTFWFTDAGDKRMGGDDKLYLDGIGPDRAIHGELPQQTGLFWGDYNIYRGENQDPLIIHYESRFPTEFNPHSGIPRAFMCELQCAEFETDSNPKGLGRVHGSTYPPGTTEGNINGPNDNAGGTPVGTIRNVLTFPPTRNRPNVAPGLPEDAPDSQTNIAGFPEVFK